MRTIHFFRSAPHIALLLSLLLSACSDSANEQNSTNNGSAQILINVSNTSVLEGDNGLSQLVFRVGLSKIASNDITVGYVTQNGLADSASDFVFIQDTLLIPAGSLTNTVRIDVNGDIQPEQHETMTLTLSNPTGAVLGNAVAMGTIIDDDVRLLNVANVRAIEGDRGTSILSFEVSLDQIATTDVSVEYATKDGNATTQDNDFVTSTGILTIPTGGKTANIAVTINGDSNIEYDETFTLELSNISNNAVLSRGSVIATIVGDDIIIAKIDLPKTGQKNCFNSKGNIVSCAATGQDGDQQQGVNWPNPRFSQNVNNTITDNLTNLVWPQDWNTSAIQLVTWQADRKSVV